MKKENICKLIADYIEEWFVNKGIIGPDSVNPVISNLFNQLYSVNHQLNYDHNISYMFLNDFIDEIYSNIESDSIKEKISCDRGDGNA